METQEFIESGLLEAHMLGLANKDEQEQVRNRVAADNVLEAYAISLESGIFRYLDNNSVNPPEEVREIVRLRTTSEKKPKHQFGNARANAQILDVEVNDTHMKVHKLWRPAFIAVFILSKIFLIAGLYYYFKSVSQNDELQRLKLQIEQTR